MDLKDIITRLGHSKVNNEKLSLETIREIDFAQITLRVKLAPRMATTGVLVAFALIWSFSNDIHSTGLRYAFAGLLLSYGALVAAGHIWKTGTNIFDRLVQFKIVFTLLQLLIGICWSAVLIVGLKVANPIQTSALFALAIGLMSAPAFSGPALYALGLWTPVTIGAFLALIFSVHTLNIPALVGLLTYAALTFTTILSVNATTIDREVRRIEAERQTELISLLLRDFQDDASDFLWEADAALALMRPSRRFAEAAYTTQGALEHMSIIRLLTDHQDADEAGEPSTAIAILLDHIGNARPFYETTVWLRFGDHARCWALTGKPVFNTDGKFAGYRGVGSDVTDTRQAEQKIAYIARHDSLTGLANRMSFDTALDALCAAPPQAGAALLCVDLDHFKSVNDRFGHHTGDALLVAAVKRMLGCIRAKDQPFRIGGDEFAIILPETDPADADAIAARIVTRLAQKFHIDAIDLTIGACVGIAMVTEPGSTPLEIHHAADVALYRAKAEGRGTWRSFAAEPDSQTQRLRDVRFALNNALDLDAFYLEFQPIVRLQTSRLTAVEALVRWHHPQHGVLRPDLFIPEAEHSGAIIPIGRQIISTACAAASRLPPHVTVAINLSPVQLHDATLLDSITDCLTQHGVSPSRIEFELTETAILDMTPQTVAVLDDLKALGCRLGLDDFGSGYSSIATLYYFRFDRLKIDRSLIRDAMNDERRRTILRNITRLAREIGIVVTGEGAETLAQRILLADLGFDDGQGLLFSPPLREAALLAWLAQREAITAVS